MQPRPTAAELLATVADVLERELVPALRGPAQHHARVAASLVGIVERELRLGPDAAAREEAVVVGLLRAGGAADASVDGVPLAELRERLASALRDGLADDPALAPQVWDGLMAMVRDDLAIAKPGHDAWDGD